MDEFPGFFPYSHHDFQGSAKDTPYQQPEQIHIALGQPGRDVHIPNKYSQQMGTRPRSYESSFPSITWPSTSRGSNAVSSQGGLGIHCFNLLGLFWEYVGPISLGNKKAHKESPSCNLQPVALSVARKASIPHAFSVRKLSKQCCLYAPFVPAFHVFRISKKPCL